MFDRLLCLAFRVYPSRRLSDWISERRCNARYAAAKAAHIAAGGVVATYESDAGTSSFFL